MRQNEAGNCRDRPQRPLSCRRSYAERGERRVSQVLTHYSAGHGDIQVTIVTESSAALHDILQAGAIDLAVVDGGFDAEGFNSILLDTDYFVAAVANDNPLAQKSIIYLSDLRSERLILRTPGSGTRDLFEAHLQSVGIQLAIFKI